ncbi:hypothetical protein J5N97_008324 [Dioscorea zingiberensis]|uniref:protein-serine/threonine phosphatase n=1 Tax=Dioscorea zingiberensis TaxID=325984 RepID=A0A9D5DDK7_9LILI|nr:hypothetical protein J5N97_008324 [Dioscorea zingiberensis]
MGCGPSLSLRPSAARGGGRDGGATAANEPDEALGHSFRYSRSSSISGETSFKAIFGAALSANSSAPLPSLPFRFLSSSSSSSSSSSLFLSGPLHSFSGPIPRGPPRPLKPSLLRRSLSEKNRPWVVPLRSFRRPDLNLDFGGQSVQWAHGKAGEDRVHVVVSEDSRWLFVGIYDGFNGPDAPEFLVSRFYSSLLLHLHGLFWLDDDDDQERPGKPSTRPLWRFLESQDGDAEFDLSGSRRFAFSLSRLRSGLGRIKVLPRWKVAREEKAGRDQRRQKAGPVADHGLVLRALSRALEATETEYMEMTDRAMASNPELALTGSCLLAVLVRDDDVYVMNLGDSRAIVAQRNALDECGAPSTELAALQLSMDHSTSIQQEVLRIKEEHPDDDQCIVNQRVKGRLKVTRAFGAGFLKQPKWNNGLLEMFRNKYIGSAPYISSVPSLCHHKLGPDDQFLVISSDGLYQYLSNEEVVSHVEHFMGNFPDGDPAQSLIEELLSRAAKKAGMELYELLDIPQGDRRKYHDDVTVMIISLEGRIWESSGKCL